MSRARRGLPPSISTAPATSILPTPLRREVTPKVQRQWNCLRIHLQNQHPLVRQQTIHRSRQSHYRRPNHSHHQARQRSLRRSPVLRHKPVSLAILRQANESPPSVEDKDEVDPAARGLITRGWASYYLPYSPVRWQEARRDFERALELDLARLELALPRSCLPN